MRYVSKKERETQKKERETQRARQEEQQERARWMQLTDAIKYVQEKNGCSEMEAAEQLITAIVDQVLPACWDDEGGLEGIIPGELTGTVKVCLDGVGYVKRNYAAAKAQREIMRLQRPKKTIYAATKAKPGAPWTDGYPNIQFVEGPVVDIDFDKDTPYSEVNTLSYIPLLVAGEYLSRWPFADTGTKAPDSRRNARRSSSNEEIRKALRKLLNDEKAAGRKPPNDEELWKMLGAWDIGPRQRVREVLREKEFSSRERLRPGERWRERKTGR